MLIRHYINLVEAMTEFLDPEDIIDYDGLVDYARQFAEKGIPPHPIRASLGMEHSRQRPAWDVWKVVRCLMTPSNGWLVPINSGMQLLMNAKHLPEAEQDRLLARFEEGHKTWFFHRSNVDVTDLDRCCAGVPKSARPQPPDDI